MVLLDRAAWLEDIHAACSLPGCSSKSDRKPRPRIAGACRAGHGVRSSSVVRPRTRCPRHSLPHNGKPLLETLSIVWDKRRVLPGARDFSEMLASNADLFPIKKYRHPRRQEPQAAQAAFDLGIGEWQLWGKARGGGRATRSRTPVTGRFAALPRPPCARRDEDSEGCGQKPDINSFSSPARRGRGELCEGLRPDRRGGYDEHRCSGEGQQVAAPMSHGWRREQGPVLRHAIMTQ